MAYNFFWTEEATNNLEEIIDYLNSEWTQRELDSFKLKLLKLIDQICRNPYMFPVSSFQPRLRKAVLSKQTSLFYEVKGNNIYLAYLFVNYKSPDRLK